MPVSALLYTLSGRSLHYSCSAAEGVTEGSLSGVLLLSICFLHVERMDATSLEWEGELA